MRQPKGPLRPQHNLLARALLQLHQELVTSTELSRGLQRASHLIISVHLTASWSSMSLSLYWFLSIKTRAISTRVKRFRWAVGTSLWAHRKANVAGTQGHSGAWQSQPLPPPTASIGHSSRCQTTWGFIKPPQLYLPVLPPLAPSASSTPAPRSVPHNHGQRAWN